MMIPADNIACFCQCLVSDLLPLHILLPVQMHLPIAILQNSSSVTVVLFPSLIKAA